MQSYPNSLTTNSNDGVVLYKLFYPIFSAMQEVGMVLNIYGEAASDYQNNVTIMNAENRFLLILVKLHRMFLRLKIVIEHITTARAWDMIRSYDKNIVGTITAYYMSLLVDNWASNVVRPIISEYREE
jgi:dihydroorotase